MDKNYLYQIFNANQELLQDLDRCQYLQNEFFGLLRRIEVDIPEDCRENFYKNLKTLRLNLSATTKQQGNIVGIYNVKTNKICVNENIINDINFSNNVQYVENLKDTILRVVYHELSHMASATRDEKTNYYATGFQHIEKTEDGEFLYSEEFSGMSEGFTEFLTNQAFGKRTYESLSTYGRQINFVEHLTELTDLETMKKAYYDNRNGMSPIEKKLEEIDDRNSHMDLYQDIEQDYRSTNNQNENEEYDEYLLFDIEKRLLHLSSEKAKKLLENNPNMTNDEIVDFWKRTARTMNFPEKLELMEEEAAQHKGIEHLRELFSLARQETIENKEKLVQIADIEEATKDVKISDINNEINNIRTEVQIDKDYNRETLE